MRKSETWLTVKKIKRQKAKILICKQAPQLFSCTAHSLQGQKSS